MTRRAFLRTGAVSTSIFWSAPAWCLEDFPGPPSDSEILSHASASIERHRKSDVTVRVQNSKGEPARNVPVKLEQLRHEFLFGCNLFLFEHCGDPELEDKYREQFAALFNYCTLGFYWAAYEARQGKPNYDYTDRVVEWTKQHGIACKGHPLVWDHPAGSPGWLPNDPAEIARLLGERIKRLVTRFQGRIGFWDVVNEATHLPQQLNHTLVAAWGAGLGQVAYSSEPLKIAREADKTAVLLVNDYRTDAAYFELLARLRHENKLLFDAVGIQSHMHDGIWPLHKTHTICEQYSRLKLPIHFTETTILSGSRGRSKEEWDRTSADGEGRQAEQVLEFYTALFAHPAVRGITWWDFSDEQAWQGAPGGLLRHDMTPKPAYDQLRDLIKQKWWTNAESVSDERGDCLFRAFHGQHRVTAGGPGKTAATASVKVTGAQANEITLIL